jgi:hypothetical protein
VTRCVMDARPGESVWFAGAGNRRYSATWGDLNRTKPYVQSSIRTSAAAQSWNGLPSSVSSLPSPSHAMTSTMTNWAETRTVVASQRVVNQPPADR